MCGLISMSSIPPSVAACTGIIRLNILKSMIVIDFVLPGLFVWTALCSAHKFWLPDNLCYGSVLQIDHWRIGLYPK